MSKLTPAKLNVLRILYENGEPMSPTEIGFVDQPGSWNPSARISSQLKVLVANKFVKRIQRKVEGTRRPRVEYRLLKKGERLVA